MNLICTYFGLNCGGDFEAYEQRYIEHLSMYGISYGTKEEYAFRLEQFATTDARISQINAEETSFQLSHNLFSTWTDFEKKRMVGKFPIDMEANTSEQIAQDLDGDDAAGGVVDWRTKGAVNEVQN